MTRAPSSRVIRPSAPGTPSPATSTRKSSPASATPTLILSRRSCSTWGRRSMPCPADTNWSRSSQTPRSFPLFFTSDIVIGETTMYADYIFPDLTYLERWEFSGSHPSVTPKVAPFRQPAAAPLTDTVTVYGEKMPLSLESIILGLAEKMKSAWLWGERLRTRPPLQAGRRPVPAHGGQYRLRRQARRLRKGAGGQRRRNPDLRKGPTPPAAHHVRSEPLAERSSDRMVRPRWFTS